MFSNPYFSLPRYFLFCTILERVPVKDTGENKFVYQNQTIQLVRSRLSGSRRAPSSCDTFWIIFKTPSAKGWDFGVTIKYHPVKLESTLAGTAKIRHYHSRFLVFPAIKHSVFIQYQGTDSSKREQKLI